MKQAASEGRLDFLDLNGQPLERNGKLRPEIFRWDRLHLNDAGYRLCSRSAQAVAGAGVGRGLAATAGGERCPGLGSDMASSLGRLEQATIRRALSASVRATRTRMRPPQRGQRS
jgi:hypothetical protein